ncbi:vesicle-trafficking protein SEC22c isoform 2-T4 [Thomomys bottae]
MQETAEDTGQSPFPAPRGPGFRRKSPLQHLHLLCRGRGMPGHLLAAVFSRQGLLLSGDPVVGIHHRLRRHQSGPCLQALHLPRVCIIQKTKWHFNCVSSPQLRSSVDKIHEELQIQPPAILTLQDTDSANSTLANGQPPVYSEPAPNFRMEPVSALGILSLVLNIMCAALNLIRGVHLAEHALQVTLEEIGHILAFLIPFAACAFQCYLYLVYSPARRAKAALLLLSICLGNAYLHGLRNLWQILFHVGVAVLSSHQILSRRPRSARADCGV